MATLKTTFSCQECAAQYSQWQGQCRDCGAWNTITEEVVASKNKRDVGYAGEAAKLTLLKDVALEEQPRLATGLAEFDHVLGGGLVADSVVLIGGDPGVGKSTLLLQVLTHLTKHYRTLYITGEESLSQVALRAKRLELNADQLTLIAETNVERTIALAQQSKPQVMVIDSIQTMFTDIISAAPGGVSQVRESAARLVRFAKQQGIALFLVGHVTKDGAIAGPRVLEHMVDAVLYFEGSNDSRFRLVRAVKNRFGAVNEIGVFAMTDHGLKQINNPSAIFLSGYQRKVPGSSIMVTWEGSRPLLVEVQALVDTSHLGNPRRVTVGLEQNRLAMLLAVLHRHGGIASYDQDVFVNVVGGLRVSETAADLALLLAVISSLKNQPLPEDLVVFGEIGLSGEIRPVPSGQERLKEAAKHGFKRAIVPAANKPKQLLSDLNVSGVITLSQVLNLL
jgi:DNA repair protein RadA/Sms